MTEQPVQEHLPTRPLLAAPALRALPLLSSSAPPARQLMWGAPAAPLPWPLMPSGPSPVKVLIMPSMPNLHTAFKYQHHVRPCLLTFHNPHFLWRFPATAGPEPNESSTEIDLHSSQVESAEMAHPSIYIWKSAWHLAGLTRGGAEYGKVSTATFRGPSDMNVWAQSITRGAQVCKQADGHLWRGLSFFCSAPWPASSAPSECPIWGPVPLPTQPFSSACIAPTDPQSDPPRQHTSRLAAVSYVLHQLT